VEAAGTARRGQYSIGAAAHHLTTWELVERSGGSVGVEEQSPRLWLCPQSLELSGHGAGVVRDV